MFIVRYTTTGETLATRDSLVEARRVAAFNAIFGPLEIIDPNGVKLYDVGFEHATPPAPQH
jgi:hypothetical protein